jgi:hypothetical protein
MCLDLSTIFIILFIIIPLNTFMLSSILGKVIVLTLLGYILFYNTQQTNKFVNNFNVNILDNSNWSPLKTNVLCSYIFSIFILGLVISVVRHIF